MNWHKYSMYTQEVLAKYLSVPQGHGENIA